MDRFISKPDLIGFLAALLLLVPVLAQTTTRSSEADNRKICAANLRGTMQSMCVYANDNADAFPALAGPVSGTHYDASLKEDPGDKNVNVTLNQLYAEKKYPNNPMANMWILVLTGQVAPRQFLCPSDTLADKPATTTKNGVYLYNFADPKNISYSSAYPWTADDARGTAYIGSWWRNQTDASLPLLSDMAPYLGTKAKAGEVATRPANSKASDPMDTEWAVKKANSQNHAFEGQNVAYGDAHAEWTRNPLVGQEGDSIWGIRVKDSEPKEIPIEAGTLPHSPGGRQGNYDIVMVPTRDSKGNLMGTTVAKVPSGLP